MSLDDVAKEVGLTHFLKSNTVVVVNTGTVDAEARRYADQVMVASNLAVVLIDGRDLKAIAGSPTRIVDIFEREARHAMELKTLEDLSEQDSRRPVPSPPDDSPEPDRS